MAADEAVIRIILHESGGGRPPSAGTDAQPPSGSPGTPPTQPNQPQRAGTPPATGITSHPPQTVPSAGQPSQNIQSAGSSSFGSGFAREIGHDLSDAVREIGEEFHKALQPIVDILSGVRKPSGSTEQGRGEHIIGGGGLAGTNPMADLINATVGTTDAIEQLTKLITRINEKPLPPQPELRKQVGGETVKDLNDLRRQIPLERSTSTEGLPDLDINPEQAAKDVEKLRREDTTSSSAAEDKEFWKAIRRGVDPKVAARRAAEKRKRSRWIPPLTKKDIDAADLLELEPLKPPGMLGMGGMPEYYHGPPETKTPVTPGVHKENEEEAAREKEIQEIIAKMAEYTPSKEDEGLPAPQDYIDKVLDEMVGRGHHEPEEQRKKKEIWGKLLKEKLAALEKFKKGRHNKKKEKRKPTPQPDYEDFDIPADIPLTHTPADLLDFNQPTWPGSKLPAPFEPTVIGPFDSENRKARRRRTVPRFEQDDEPPGPPPPAGGGIPTDQGVIHQASDVPVTMDQMDAIDQKIEMAPIGIEGERDPVESDEVVIGGHKTHAADFGTEEIPLDFTHNFKSIIDALKDVGESQSPSETVAEPSHTLPEVQAESAPTLSQMLDTLKDIEEEQHGPPKPPSEEIPLPSIEAMEDLKYGIGEEPPEPDTTKPASDAEIHIPKGGLGDLLEGLKEEETPPEPEIPTEMVGPPVPPGVHPDWDEWQQPAHGRGNRNWGQIGKGKFEQINEELGTSWHNVNRPTSGRAIYNVDTTEYKKIIELLKQSGKPPSDFPWFNFATGGWVGDHPGQPQGKDTIPAWLSPGEYVVNSDAAAANKGKLEEINKGVSHLAEGGSADGKNTARSAVGDVSKFMPSASVEPSDAIAKFGDIVSTVGSKIPGLGTAAMAAGESLKVFSGIMQTLNQTADRYGDYSPEIAQAQAVAEIRQTMGDVRRAQEISGEMASYLMAQSDLQQKFEDAKLKLLMKIAPAVTKILEMIGEVLDEAGSITDSISALQAPLGSMSAAAIDMLHLQKDKEIDKPKDPSEALLDPKFTMTAPTGWVPEL